MDFNIDRTIALSFDVEMEHPAMFNMGLPQVSPLSPVMFIFSGWV